MHGISPISFKIRYAPENPLSSSLNEYVLFLCQKGIYDPLECYAAGELPLMYGCLLFRENNLFLLLK